VKGVCIILLSLRSIDIDSIYRYVVVRANARDMDPRLLNEEDVEMGQAEGDIVSCPPFAGTEMAEPPRPGTSRALIV
jgi:hypothetical protein